ncbi:metallopeptidase TldD-related protein, partial [Klebsiella aerogenes]
RKTSFLLDRLGQQVFAKGVTIRDDPHRPRGLRSRPFDGEGLPVQPVKLVDAGMLETWLLDSASARQLGLEPTGHAARGIGGAPG